MLGIQESALLGCPPFLAPTPKNRDKTVMTQMIDSPAPNTTAELTFEQALADLQRTVEQLEKGQVPLADAVSLFERGTQLKQQCESRLAEAKARIDQLVIAGDGTLSTTPFDGTN